MKIAEEGQRHSCPAFVGAMGVTAAAMKTRYVYVCGG